MSSYLIILVLLAVGTLSSCLKNRFSKSILKTDTDNAAFGCAVSLVCTIFMACLGGVAAISGTTRLLAVIFGIFIAGAHITNMEAMHCGPMSLTSLMSSCGLIITVVFAWTFCKEPMTVRTVGAVVMMMAGIALIIQPKGEDHVSRKWVFLAFWVFFFSGAMGVVQKILEMKDLSGEIMGFLFFSFLISVVILLGYALIKGKVQKVPLTLSFGKGSVSMVLFTLAVGILMALGHILTIKVVEVMPASVAFPIVDGGGILLVTLADAVLFHQKLNKAQIAGLILAGAAIVILS